MELIIIALIAVEVVIVSTVMFTSDMDRAHYFSSVSSVTGPSSGKWLVEDLREDMMIRL